MVRFYTCCYHYSTSTYSSPRCFWINLPLCAISFVGLWTSLHLHYEISSLRAKLARIDYIGMVVFTAASSAFLVGITTGGSLNPWSSASVLAPMIIGLVLFGAFILIEWKVAKEPMVPLRVFRDRTAAAAFFGFFIHGLVVWAFAYYMIIFVRLYSTYPISPLCCLTHT